MKNIFKSLLAMTGLISMYWAGYMASNLTENWGWFYGAGIALTLAIGAMEDEKKS